MSEPEVAACELCGADIQKDYEANRRYKGVVQTIVCGEIDRHKIVCDLCLRQIEYFCGLWRVMYERASTT